jgi:hypothetical protein
LYIFCAVVYYFYTDLLVTNYCTIIFLSPTGFGWMIADVTIWREKNNCAAVGD